MCLICCIYIGILWNKVCQNIQNVIDFFIKKRVFVYDGVSDVQTCLYVCKKWQIVVDEREKPKGKGNNTSTIVYRDLINSILSKSSTDFIDHVWESNQNCKVLVALKDIITFERIEYIKGI